MKVARLLLPVLVMLLIVLSPPIAPAADEDFEVAYEFSPDVVGSQGGEVLPASFDEGLIAPRGMNCALCIGYLRDKTRRPGCNGGDDAKPRSCARCSIKTCVDRRGDYCFECARYPCPRLRRLDARTERSTA
jgi:hypothetical protein